MSFPPQSRQANNSMRRGSRHNLTRDEWRSVAYVYTPRGNDLPHARLDADTVRSIRSSPMTAAQLAARYGVHVRTIDGVRQYRTWRHIL